MPRLAAAFSPNVNQNPLADAIIAALPKKLLAILNQINALPKYNPARPLHNCSSRIAP
jgi:hypothetical protein